MAVNDALERDELELQKLTVEGFKKNTKPGSAAERSWDANLYWLNNRLNYLKPTEEKNTSSATIYNNWEFDKYEGEYEKYKKRNQK